MQLNTIYNEHCLDTMARMKDGFVDLVVTSPPYNMRNRVRNGEYTVKEKAESFSRKYIEYDDALPIDEFYNLHSNILNELLRVSKIVCYNFQIVTGSKEAFFKIIGDFSKYIKDVVIWDKKTSQPAMHNNILNSCFEIILILEPNQRCGRFIENANFRRGTFNNLLRISCEKKMPEANGAVFPLKLPLVLIESFSQLGALVYDPFMGLGTTALAASMCDRYFIGSEIIKRPMRNCNAKTSVKQDAFQHMEPFTLINPKGQSRDFGFVQFYAFKIEVAKSKSFRTWAEENKLSAWKNEKGESRLVVPVVDRFLKEKGYKVIDNDIFGRKTKQVQSK